MVNSPQENQSGRKLFYGLFIFPLVIAVGMAVLLCTVVLLTKETETPESLITSIKTGTPSKRWQKAFELSNEINQGRGMIRESGVMKEVIHILKERKEYDPKTRSYMAIALSKFDAPEVVPALEEVLGSEEDPNVQFYLIWALGVKKSRTSMEKITPYLKNPDEGVRKVAAYVVGGFADPKASPYLTPLLDDSSKDVRWNAALGLARLGDLSAYPVLVTMLDRDALAREQISEEKIEEIMVNGVKGLVLLDHPEVMKTLASISDSEKSLKVRQAAIEAIEFKKSRDGR